MYKRWMSLLLAMILTVSLVLPGNAVALTTDAQENTEVVDETIEASGTTEPSDPTETTDATEPSDPTEVIDATEPSDPTDATEATEATEPDTEETDPSGVIPDWILDAQSGDEGISVMSLRPLEEVNCYLYLSAYSEEQLTALTIDDILSMLQDYDGNSVPLDESATTVWQYVLDESDNIETYKEYTIGSGETFALTYPEGATAIQLELIVGSNGQLSPNNKRYIVKAYLIDIFEVDLDVEIYLQAEDNTRTQAIPDDCKEWIFEFSDGVTEEIVFDLSFGETIMGSLADHGTVWLNVTSDLVADPRVEIVVYPVLVLNEGYATIMQPITDQILNQNMAIAGAGYQISGEKNTDTTYQIRVYVNGEEHSRKYFSVRYWNWYPCHEGTLFAKQDGVSTNVFETLTTDFDATAHVNNIVFELNSGLSSNDEYYFNYDFVMRKNFGGTADLDNYDAMVEKVVVGHYESIEEAEAAGAKDVTADILSNGYLANYGGDGIDFTVFKYYRMSESFPLIYDTLADKITVKAVDNSDIWREYTDAPIIGEEDPWFRVTGVNDASGNALDVYIVENGDTVNMDTSYGYGNQTIFINDSNVDLTQLKPTIWRADSDRITVYVNGVLYNEGDIIDCTDMVTFTAIIDGHQKTYNVNFMKKSSGPSLYVFGSTTREVLLDEYFEKKHDILIANMGDEELTGLRVELNATNCQLDEYWTIGGNGNDTLAPFTETSSNTEYGELNNLAKIRLVPVDEEDMVGNGEIEGTLTIYADGQEPVVITLTGQALNPQITTNQESFASYTAVKYVPYAYVITTSNMHDWIDTSFTMTGDLPAGMEFYPETGEIYGVPQATGEFNIRIEASFESETSGFESSSIELTLTVLDNTNENVYEASDANYQIKQHVGTQTGDYDFVLETIENTEFTSHGEFGEFVNIYLNGEKLVWSEDPELTEYFKEEGSTKITIKSQTIEEKTNDDGSENTIAMEFRTDTDGDGKANDDGDLNRTAQNFTVKSDVEKVIEQIAALPTNINLSHKSQVQAARAAYNALSDTDKAKVTNYSKLTDAEAKISRLEADQSAANKVIKMINDLPTRIALTDQAAVEAARAAYDALTSAQKNLVTNYERLQDAEAAIAQLKADHEENEKNKAAAKVVIDLIEALPTPVTLADKDAVGTARGAYNNLTAEQKGYVTNYDKLTTAEATIAELEAAEKEKAEVNAVIALINRIPNPVTLDDKDSVEVARAAYDALSPEQQEGVVNYKTLTDAEARIAALEAQEDLDKENKEAANRVIALIDALPANITLVDKDQVVAARDAYDALTEAQKLLVNNYTKLTDAEARIKALEDLEAAEEADRTAAADVIELIDALPEEITLEDKDQVVVARDAYDALTEAQKLLVNNYTKLTDAEARIKALEDLEAAEEADRTAAADVIELIDALPEEITLEDKDQVVAARAAYDALTESQRQLVTNFNDLIAAETRIKALEDYEATVKADQEAANNVAKLIDAIPEPVTLDDRDMVEAARDAYNALTDTQKQMVPNYSDLTDAEADIKTLENYAAADEADRAAADAVIKLIDELPEEITLDDKAKVEEARNAYNNLTENQKSIVTNYDKLATAESKIAELEDSEYEEMQSVTLVAILVDADGKPLADTAIELHSVVQNGRTDENGSILFTGVEFGEHTIYTKDANSNTTSQKSFTIVLGAPLGISGDVITVENGAVFTVTIQRNGSALTFLSVEEGNQAPEIDTDKDDEDDGIDIGDGDDDKDSDSSSDPDDSIPQTGDESHLMFWNTMMFVSLAGFFMIPMFFGRKRGKYERRR